MIYIYTWYMYSNIVMIDILPKTCIEDNHVFSFWICFQLNKSQWFQAAIVRIPTFCEAAAECQEYVEMVPPVISWFINPINYSCK